MAATERGEGDAPAPPRLVLEDVAKRYGATVALARGSLTLEAGEVHVLIGSNGSGKSTLCKIVAGSVAPGSGTVRLGGERVEISGPAASRALGIGVFYQELSLAAHRTVAENVALPALAEGRSPFVDRAALRDRATPWIERFADVAGEGFTADARVASLRADQRQLVEIVKCLATEAPILVFDEPTSALDRAQVERLFAVLAELRAAGRSIVFISHRMDEIFEIGDRVTVIRDGETVATAALADVDADTVVRWMVGTEGAAALLGRGEGERPSDGDGERDGSDSNDGHGASDERGSDDGDGASDERGSNDGGGADGSGNVGGSGRADGSGDAASSGDPVAPTETADDAIVLAVEGLSGDGCDDIDLVVRRGEIVGLGGLHGQGQSALLRTLFGLAPRRAGHVRLGGVSLDAASPRAAVRRGCAYVSGDRARDGVITGRPILENVVPVHALKRRLALARPGALGRVAARALAVLDTRYASLGHPIGSLSGGNQQKVVIARWLTERPTLLLLDDPTKGIDLAAKRDLFREVRALAADGVAILLHSSEDAELLANADRILVFNAGRVARELAGAARTRFDLYRAAYGAEAPTATGGARPDGPNGPNGAERVGEAS